VRLSPAVDFTYASTTKTVTLLGNHNIDSMIVATYNEEVGGTIDENDPRLTDDRTTSGIRTATTVVKTSDSSSPSEGQVLVANSSTQAEWNDLLIFNEVPTGTKDDTNQDFTLSRQPMNENDIMVFVNGLLQKKGSDEDFTLSGDTLTFAVPPNEVDLILVTYRPNYS
jgi:aspartokinase